MLYCFEHWFFIKSYIYKHIIFLQIGNSAIQTFSLIQQALPVYNNQSTKSKFEIYFSEASPSIY